MLMVKCSLAVFVSRALPGGIHGKIMRRLTKTSKIIPVSFVTSDSTSDHLLSSMFGFTLAKGGTNAEFAARHSLNQLTDDYMRKLTMEKEKSLLSATYVKKPFPLPPTLEST